MTEILKEEDKLWSKIEEEEKNFSTIRQGVGTNALAKINANTKTKRNAVIDPITGDATIIHGNFIITITDFMQLAGLRTSTHQLLDAFIVVFTETGAKSPVVSLSLEKYMAIIWDRDTLYI